MNVILSGQSPAEIELMETQEILANHQSGFFTRCPGCRCGNVPLNRRGGRDHQRCQEAVRLADRIEELKAEIARAPPEVLDVAQPDPEIPPLEVSAPVQTSVTQDSNFLRNALIIGGVAALLL